MQAARGKKRASIDIDIQLMYLLSMAFTLDSLLTALRATAFHPVTSLLPSRVLILIIAEHLPLNITADISSANGLDPSPVD